MRYQGGKYRLRHWVSGELRKLWTGQPYLEPFVGGASVFGEVSKWCPDCNISDIDEDLISLYRGLAEGWQPPSRVTEEEYKALRLAETSPLKGFAKFACSWGGKAWSGYARSLDRNYASNALASLVKLVPRLKQANIFSKPYSKFEPVNCLIYCDPPYADTTGYEQVFDHAKFWQTMRDWSKSNQVLISEYQAPPDFVEMSSFNRLQDMRFKSGRAQVTEKLFKWSGQAEPGKTASLEAI